MLTDPLPYVTALKLGSHGPAVEGAKRAVYRFLNNAKWQGFIRQPQAVRRTFGPFFRKDVIIVQGVLSAGHPGWLDKPTLDGLVAAGSFDAPARALWLEQFGKPKPSPMIEPYQGFASLIRELWPTYTIGRQMGFLDGPVNGRPTASGTYADKPGDHGFWPSYAFDLDIIRHTGWENEKARHFFELVAPRPEVHYVILGDRISSKERGLHSYTGGGHENHVHVSGLH